MNQSLTVVVGEVVVEVVVVLWKTVFWCTPIGLHNQKKLVHQSLTVEVVVDAVVVDVVVG